MPRFFVAEPQSDREEVVGDDRVLQRSGELLARDLALLEVALHQRLVGLDDGVDELLSVVRGLRRDLLRDVDGVAFAVRPPETCTRACGRGRRCP